MSFGKCDDLVKECRESSDVVVADLESGIDEDIGHIVISAKVSGDKAVKLRRV